MATVYLIGGTPRTGKTTLTLRALKQLPVLATSTDAIRSLLRNISTPASQPDLFQVDRYHLYDLLQHDQMRSRPQEIIALQQKESAVVWRSVVDFIHSNIATGFDVLIEGVAVLPEFVQQLECEYKVVFIGNQSLAHHQTIHVAARRNPYDWMHSLESETIEAFAVYLQAFSHHIEQQARQYNMPYVEVRDDSFEQDIAVALGHLLAHDTIIKEKSTKPTGSHLQP